MPRVLLKNRKKAHQRIATDMNVTDYFAYIRLFPVASQLLLPPVDGVLQARYPAVKQKETIIFPETSFS
jgi:hypothetical protein